MNYTKPATCPHCNTSGLCDIDKEGRSFFYGCNCHDSPSHNEIIYALEEWNKYVEKENYILKYGEGAWLELHPEGHDKDCPCNICNPN